MEEGKREKLACSIAIFQYHRKQGWDLIFKIEFCFKFWKNVVIYLWDFFW